MVIEPATTDDAGAIADLWVALAADQRDHGSHILPEENRAAIRDAALRRIVADELLVAREDQGLVGFVMFTTEAGQYDQDVRRGIVENLYVTPEFRDGGLGTALLTAAEEQFAADGVEAVALDVMADNDAARRFYRRQGYRSHRLELEKSLENDTL